jgi:hypothetical protein
MSAAIRICCLLAVAALSGCAQSAGLLNLSVLQPSEEGTPSPSTDTPASVENSKGLPLPERSARRVAQARPAAPAEPKQGGLSLAALADVKILTASTDAADTSEWEARPVVVYTQLAQQIRSCWLKPGASKLPGHGFHAEVGAGDPDQAKIILYEKAPDGKRGLQAFRLLIDGRSSGAIVKAENRKLDKKLDQTFKTDLVRWAQGKRECSG